MPSFWTADDPAVARAERFFLLYSPVWMAAVALVQLTGWLATWGEVGFLVFGLVVGLTPVVWPAVFWRGAARRAALRWNLWIAGFVFVGTWALTHYFFDVLGMHYRFPVRWTGQAALVGRSGQEVPLFLYPLTQAYFLTYHVVMVVVMRAIGRALDARLASRLLRGAVFAGALVAVCYGVAFAETAFMANDLLADWFWYEDRAWMLRWGSLFYASYFVVSVPLLLRLNRPGDTRGPGALVVESLGAGMLVMVLLELWTALLL